MKEDVSENSSGWWRGNVRANYYTENTSTSARHAIMLVIQYNPLFYLHFFVFGMLLAILRQHLVAAATSSCQPPDAFSALRKRMMLTVWHYGNMPPALSTVPPAQLPPRSARWVVQTTRHAFANIYARIRGARQLDMFALPLTRGAAPPARAMRRRDARVPRVGPGLRNTVKSRPVKAAVRHSAAAVRADADRAHLP
jgi:hypothetical protein